MPPGKTFNKDLHAAHETNNNCKTDLSSGFFTYGNYQLETKLAASDFIHFKVPPVVLTSSN